jgi:hypothetical protein
MAYCVFPNATFGERKCYALKNWQPQFDVLDEKYAKRGWKTIRDVHTDHTRQGFSKSVIKRGFRSLGDSFTWRVPLDTTGVTEGMPSAVFRFSFFYIFRITPWPLARHLRRPQVSHYHINAEDFESGVLEHTYTYPNRGFLYDKADFWHSIAHYTEHLTSCGISHLDFSKQRALLLGADTRWSPWDLYFHNRPSPLWRLAAEIRKDPPQGWVFLDAYVEQWYATWLAHRALQKARDKEVYLAKLRRTLHKKEKEFAARSRLTRQSMFALPIV